MMAYAAVTAIGLTVPSNIFDSECITYKSIHASVKHGSILFLSKQSTLNIILFCVLVIRM
jgi:hypothetical protein